MVVEIIPLTECQGESLGRMDAECQQYSTFSLARKPGKGKLFMSGLKVNVWTGICAPEEYKKAATQKVPCSGVSFLSWMGDRCPSGEAG
jgi:hypothetical protein